MPVTATFDAPTLPVVKRTAGDRARRPAPPGRRRAPRREGEKPVGVGHDERALEGRGRRSRSTPSTPAAKIDTNVTSATPIISAAAVDAVRRGLAHRVLARETAGDAAQPLERPPDRPTPAGARATGSAAPTRDERRRARRRRAPRAALLARPSRTGRAGSARRRDRERCTRAIVARQRRGPTVGTARRACSAAIGETRVARIAGHEADSSVTSVPTISETIRSCAARSRARSPAGRRRPP